MATGCGNGHAQHAPSAVLFVDDNVALLRSVERLLRLEGYEVRLAANGSEALVELEGNTTPPDLIISDIAMPDMDGFEFYRAVRRHREWVQIPFVFLTARDQMEDLETGYSLGADDYLIKPLDQERLLMIIRSKIERSRELTRHIDRQQQAIATVQRELSMMVSHELRTPLVSITMVSNLLADEFDQMDQAQVRELLGLMQSGSVRMNRLVEQMVLHVQAQSGALENDIRNLGQRVPLELVLHTALAKAQQWDYRNLAIPIEVELKCPDLMVDVEQTALSHAIAEVLHNAIMFSPPDGTIRMTQGRDDTHVWVTVEDQGRGIPQEVQPNVFQVFFQYNRTQYEQQGVGLGLKLVESIVHAHDGHVMLESAPGEGTRVTLYLPVG